MGRNVDYSEVDWRKKVKGGEVDMGEAGKPQLGIGSGH